jgi:hypothetical protein
MNIHICETFRSQRDINISVGHICPNRLETAKFNCIDFLRKKPILQNYTKHVIKHRAH